MNPTTASSICEKVLDQLLAINQTDFLLAIKCVEEIEWILEQKKKELKEYEDQKPFMWVNFAESGQIRMWSITSRQDLIDKLGQDAEIVELYKRPAGSRS